MGKFRVLNQPEFQEKTHADAWRACKLTGRQTWEHQPQVLPVWPRLACTFHCTVRFYQKPARLPACLHSGRSSALLRYSWNATLSFNPVSDSQEPRDLTILQLYNMHNSPQREYLTALVHFLKVSTIPIYCNSWLTHLVLKQNEETPASHLSC